MKEILLAEYNALKTEQLERIKHRDNIIYVLLGAAGTLLSFAIIHNANYVAAIIPMVSFVLCWIYLTNDRKISEIATYIEDDLAVQLSSCINNDEQNEEGPICNWEVKHKTYTGRKVRKLIQYIVDILIFGFPALIGVLATNMQSNSFALLTINSVFFIGIIILIIVQYNDRRITQEE